MKNLKLTLSILIICMIFSGCAKPIDDIKVSKALILSRVKK